MENYLQDVPEIKASISRPVRSVIISHRNPDGDAIGSSIGLKLFLLKLGHTVHIIFPSEYPLVYEYLPGAKDILITDIDSEEVKSIIESADIIWALDFNALDRIDKTGEMVHQVDAQKIMIDHHIDPEPFTDLMISKTDSSSTCELVYDMIVEGWGDKHLDTEICSCLMVGILTDTGSLSYSVSPDLLRKVAMMVEKGVNYTDIQDRVFNSVDEKQIRLLGHCLANRMELYPEDEVGIIYLTKEDYKKYDIQRGDTEGIVNQLLKIQFVKIAVFITEQPTIIKFSFRSKGDISVAAIARAHFNGGGHKNASGGYMHSSLQSAKNKVRQVFLHNYQTKHKSNHEN